MQVKSDMGNPGLLSSWSINGSNPNPCGTPAWQYITCTGGLVTTIKTMNAKFTNGTMLPGSLSAITSLTTLSLR